MPPTRNEHRRPYTWADPALIQGGGGVINDNDNDNDTDNDNDNGGWGVTNGLRVSCDP